MRAIDRVCAAAGGALTLAAALTGCAFAPSPAEVSAPGSTGLAARDRASCDGIYTLVDFGGLGPEPQAVCVVTTQALVAVDVFQRAYTDLTEGQAFPGAICRVEGYPRLAEPLTHNGETFVEDCASMPPGWAYWGLFHDTGSGWDYAAEGAYTLPVQPGQAIGLIWQFGRTETPRLTVESELSQ